MSAPDDKAFARLMHRLDVAGGKLEVLTGHWAKPFDVDGKDQGAVAIVHDLSSELDSLYCDFVDWATKKGLAKDGPWVESFAPEPEEVT